MSVQSCVPCVPAVLSEIKAMTNNCYYPPNSLLTDIHSVVWKDYLCNKCIVSQKNYGCIVLLPQCLVIVEFLFLFWFFQIFSHVFCLLVLPFLSDPMPVFFPPVTSLERPIFFHLCHFLSEIRVWSRLWLDLIVTPCVSFYSPVLPFVNWKTVYFFPSCLCACFGACF